MPNQPPSPIDRDLPAPGRLNVRLPANLRLAVQLAAEAAKTPVSSFVHEALLDRLRRDAIAAGRRTMLREAAMQRLAGALRGDPR